jgi:hypothetical protein
MVSGCVTITAAIVTHQVMARLPGRVSSLPRKGIRLGHFCHRSLV